MELVVVRCILQPEKNLPLSLMAYRVNASNWAMPGRSPGSAYAASEYTASELDPNGRLIL